MFKGILVTILTAALAFGAGALVENNYHFVGKAVDKQPACCKVKLDCPCDKCDCCPACPGTKEVASGKCECETCTCCKLCKGKK